MEDLKWNNSFDTDVSTFLCGLNLSKYIDVFSENAINLEIFLTLTKEDLNFIGITDVEDCNILIKGIRSFKTQGKDRSITNENITALSENEIVSIVSNTLTQLSILHASLAHTRLRLKKAKIHNTLLERKSMASILTLLANEALSQNIIARTRLQQLKMDDVTLTPTSYGVKRRIGWMIFTASALVTGISALALHLIRRQH